MCKWLVRWVEDIPHKIYEKAKTWQNITTTNTDYCWGRLKSTLFSNQEEEKITIRTLKKQHQQWCISLVRPHLHKLQTTTARTNCFGLYKFWLSNNKQLEIKLMQSHQQMLCNLIILDNSCVYLMVVYLCHDKVV